MATMTATSLLEGRDAALGLAVIIESVADVAHLKDAAVLCSRRRAIVSHTIVTEGVIVGTRRRGHGEVLDEC